MHFVLKPQRGDILVDTDVFVLELQRSDILEMHFILKPQRGDILVDTDVFVLELQRSDILVDTDVFV